MMTTAALASCYCEARRFESIFRLFLTIKQFTATISPWTCPWADGTKSQNFVLTKNLPNNKRKIVPQMHCTNAWRSRRANIWLGDSVQTPRAPLPGQVGATQIPLMVENCRKADCSAAKICPRFLNNLSFRIGPHRPRPPTGPTVNDDK